MKTIGIIGAMPEEVSLLKDRLSSLSEENVAGLHIFTGELHGKKVVICQSGMGKVAAGAATQVLVTKYGIDAIINSGIAGNMTSKVGIGDVVLSRTVQYHDAEISMIRQHYPNLDVYTADSRLIKAAERACDETGTKYIVGRIATGDKFIGDSRSKKAIREYCDPDCVEMEGAAIAHIACKNDIPFIIIRAMSDNADEAATDTLVVKHFDVSEYCDKAADICELTVKYR
ncbi:MAG: 5'-methylthioadenosine/adenosylhomocysteine nucleosidase [Oscillospiraceae bacterium]|nr:5'-methylthioadenosine/adenosylhomocysteine nucleosidase [Oscillospiraceae bacterium]